MLVPGTTADGVRTVGGEGEMADHPSLQLAERKPPSGLETETKREGVSNDLFLSLSLESIPRQRPLPGVWPALPETGEETSLWLPGLPAPEQTVLSL